MSSLDSKHRVKINQRDEARSGSNKVQKRSPILCEDQTGFKTSRGDERAGRRLLHQNFVMMQEPWLDCEQHLLKPSARLPSDEPPCLNN